MSTNKNLVSAKRIKNDEFYTQYKDIAEELIHYEKEFAGKIIYCNCDNYLKSNFVKYFLDNFNKFKLKKLIATCYTNKDQINTIDTVDASVVDLFDATEDKEEKIINNEKAYKFIVNSVGEKSDINSVLSVDGNYVTELNGDGNYKSEECLQILSECDLVITNPPFSLFRDYIKTMIDSGKKVIVLGNNNAVTTVDVFTLILQNKLWKGYSEGHYKFIVDYETNELKTVGSSTWFTNIDTEKRHKLFKSETKYDPKIHKEFDNYYAINVDKVKEIPMDYKGIMAVPITFIDHYCPEQFEIVNPNDYKKKYTPKQVLKLSSENGQIRAPGDRFYIGGKRVFARVFIKKKIIF